MKDISLDGESLTAIAINDIASLTLNPVPIGESASVEEALDYLSGCVRRGSLAIACALLEIAEAIREGTPDIEPTR